jgi:hypothetical protein
MKRKVKDVVTEAVKKTTANGTQSVKKVKPDAPPAFIERTVIEPRVYDVRPEKEGVCNIMCWNVAGLRGTLKNNSSVFDELVEVRK